MGVSTSWGLSLSVEKKITDTGMGILLNILAGGKKTGLEIQAIYWLNANLATCQ